MVVLFSEAKVDKKSDIVELSYSHDDILWFDITVDEVA